MEKDCVSIEAMKVVIDSLAHQPDFPDNYCNIASKDLFEVLHALGKDVRIQHSYREYGDGHSFVVEKKADGSELILDPTYAQYDPNYPKGFVGERFPDAFLEQNRIESSDFMELQKKWFYQGVYDKS